MLTMLSFSFVMLAIAAGMVVFTALAVALVGGNGPGHVHTRPAEEAPEARVIPLTPWWGTEEFEEEVVAAEQAAVTTDEVVFSWPEDWKGPRILDEPSGLDLMLAQQWAEQDAWLDEQAQMEAWAAAQDDPEAAYGRSSGRQPDEDELPF